MEHRTNCKNCGAPLLPDGSCQYCGTHHRIEKPEEPMDMYSVITMSSTGITCSIGKYQMPIHEARRDSKGRLYRHDITIGG